MIMIINNKKAVSPIIATILLIAIVIVIATLIFFWFKGFTEEAITKFGNKNIKIVCNDVKFQASYNSGILSISNTGSVPLYSLNLKFSGDGTYSTLSVEQLNIGWDSIGLSPGDAFSGDISSKVSGKTSVKIIPVLIGTSKKGESTYICDEKYGTNLNL